MKEGATTESEFEVHGYFEEFLDASTAKFYGIRIIPSLTGRKLGVEGREEKTITDSIILKKGHKDVKLNASKKKPVHLVTMVQALCGSRKVQ